MNGCYLFRNGHFGIDPHGFGGFVPIQVHLQIGNFNNPVGCNIDASSFKIKENNGILQLKPHALSIYHHGHQKHQRILTLVLGFGWQQDSCPCGIAHLQHHFV